jgi:hypothetical protein
MFGDEDELWKMKTQPEHSLQCSGPFLLLLVWTQSYTRSFGKKGGVIVLLFIINYRYNLLLDYQDMHLHVQGICDNQKKF